METTILEELQGLFQAVFAANGQSVQGSCRGFHGICVDRYTVPCRDNHGIYRRTLASTGNGTEIADIRDAVKHHKQRILALLEKERYQVLRLLVSD